MAAIRTAPPISVRRIRRAFFCSSRRAFLSALDLPMGTHVELRIWEREPGQDALWRDLHDNELRGQGGAAGTDLTHIR